MRIAGTEVNLQHKALEIYLSGCKGPHCPGCHNPELWDFDVGDQITESVMQQLFGKIDNMQKAKLLNYIWVLGGEPLDQDLYELEEFLDQLRRKAYIMLWTHYEDVPCQIYKHLMYAKLGPYVESGTPYIEPLFGIKLANKEQRIVKYHS